MNSAEKQAVLHCLKSMIDEEVCEECPLYGTTGTDHCKKDCVRLAINALEQEPTDAVDRVTIKEYLDSFKDTNEQEPCEDCVSRRAVFEILNDAYFLKIDDGAALQESVRQLPPVAPQPKSGYISIADAMSAFDDFMCNDIEPEGQEVFLELLKDRAERSKE